MSRQCEALIDLDAIRANFKFACGLAAESQSIAVIKANAYGHGAVEVAHALTASAPAFAVAIIDEASALRDAGINAPLLVMEGVGSGYELQYAARQNIAIVIHSDEQLHLLERTKLPARVAVWVKIDTGMHRLGLAPERLQDAIKRLRASDNCDPSIVVCTHLACADHPDSLRTDQQLKVFDNCVAGLGVLQSISNSAGIMAFPRSHRHWNRPGYMLYGNTPFAGDVRQASDLMPVMTLQSEVIAVRDIAAADSVGYCGRWTAGSPATIATVAIGYADGYPRHAPNGTPILINGHIAPLVGTVSMDMITVDVTAVPGVKVGDPVVLWGKGLSVNEIAHAAGTIGYELLTSVTNRVPRRYLHQ